MEKNDLIEPKVQHSQTAMLIKIIATNFVPIYGVLFMNWNAKQLITVFILETIIVVAIHFIRLKWVWLRYGQQPETLHNIKKGAVTGVSRAYLPLIFVVLCTFFLAVQMTIFNTIISMGNQGNLISEIPELIQGRLKWTLIAFIGIQFLYLSNEILTNKYNHTPVEEVFWSPFKRIIILQVVVILSGFFIPLNTSFAALFILTMIKMTGDLFTVFHSNPRLKKLFTKGDIEKEKQWEEMGKAMKE